MIRKLTVTTISGGCCDFEPKKINVITGPNGKGKTSILEAIKYALTGKTDSTNIISVVADIGFAVIDRRNINGKNVLMVDGKKTTQKSLNELFKSFVGANLSDKLIKILLSGKTLDGYNAKKIADLFLGYDLLDAKISRDVFLSLSELTEDEIDILDELHLLDKSEYTLNEVSKVYDELYKIRASINAELDFAIGKYEYQISELNRKSLVEINLNEIDLSAYDESVLQTETRALESDVNFLKQQLFEWKMYDRSLKSIKSIIDELDNVIKTSVTKPNPLSRKNIEKQMISCSDSDTVNIGDICSQLCDWHSQNTEYLISVFAERIKCLINSMMIEKPSKNEDDLEADLVAKEKQIALNQSIILSFETDRERSEFRKKYAMYSSILRKLSSDSGLKEKVLTTILEPIINELNVLISKIKDNFVIRLVPVNGELNLSVDKGFSVDHAHLSEGEKSLIELALLFALGQIANFSMIALDNLDRLDKETFGRLVNTLSGSEFQSFVFCVDHEDLLSTIDTKNNDIQVIKL